MAGFFGILPRFRCHHGVTRPVLPAPHCGDAGPAGRGDAGRWRLEAGVRRPMAAQWHRVGSPALRRAEPRRARWFGMQGYARCSPETVRDPCAPAGRGLYTCLRADGRRRPPPPPPGRHQAPPPPPWPAGLRGRVLVALAPGGAAAPCSTGPTRGAGREYLPCQSPELGRGGPIKAAGPARVFLSVFTPPHYGDHFFLFPVRPGQERRQRDRAGAGQRRGGQRRALRVRAPGSVGGKSPAAPTTWQPP